MTLLSSGAQSYVSLVVVTKAFLFDFVFPGTFHLTLQELKSATVGGVFLPTYLTSSPQVQDFLKSSIRGAESPCREFRPVCWKGSFLVPFHQSLRSSQGPTGWKQRVWMSASYWLVRILLRDHTKLFYLFVWKVGWSTRISWLRVVSGASKSGTLGLRRR